MVRIIHIDIPDQLAWLADELMNRLRDELAAAEQTITPASSGMGGRLVPDTLRNRPKVRALQGRCQRLARPIRTSDVVMVADVDESQFFKWQRGSRVGHGVQSRCERAVSLPAEEFLRRLSVCSELLMERDEEKLA